MRAASVRVLVATAVAVAALAGWAPAAVAGDEVGLVDVNTGHWRLQTDGGGVVRFTYGNPGDVPVVGDWDGDGDQTAGMYRQSDGFFYARNSNTTGIADVECFAGDPDDVAIAGDGDGDGDDTLGIFRRSEGRFYLFNKTCVGAPMGAAEIEFPFGDPGDLPVAGDWDGDGRDEVAVHRPPHTLYYRNTLDAGPADGQFTFADPGDWFVAGDWGPVDGVDTPAIWRIRQGWFDVWHTLAQSAEPDERIDFFVPGTQRPVAGEFGL